MHHNMFVRGKFMRVRTAQSLKAVCARTRAQLRGNTGYKYKFVDHHSNKHKYYSYIFFYETVVMLLGINKNSDRYFWYH